MKNKIVLLIMFLGFYFSLNSQTYQCLCMVSLSETYLPAIPISSNPMSTSARLEIPNFSNQSSVISDQLTITDITGKVVRTEPLTSMLSGSSPDETAQITILKGDLKPGIYFVEFKADRTHRGKLIVE